MQGVPTHLGQSQTWGRVHALATRSSRNKRHDASYIEVRAGGGVSNGRGMSDQSGLQLTK